MTLNDRVLGALALLLAALLVWQGWDLQAPFSYEPVGPRAFPLLLAAVIALCGLWLLLRGRDQAEANPPGANIRIAAMVAVVTGYALVFVSLGFPVATGLMAMFVGRLFGGRWLPCAAGGLVLGLGLYLLFDKIFAVVLPTGLWGLGG